MKELPGVPFGRSHADVQLIDVYLPDRSAGNGRAILCIHGGGWSGGGRGQWTSVARHFCALGYVAASADYRLTPGWKHPAQIEDVRLAVGWLRAQAAAWGFDPRRTAALGSSAGAHLVCLLATIRPDDPLGVTHELSDPRTAPDAVISYCGVLDVPDWAWRSPESVIQFLGKRAEEDPELTRSVSPVHRIRGGEPPMLFLHGDADETVPPAQSQDMERGLRAVGTHAETVVLAGVGHGYGYGVQTPAQVESLAHAERFLNRVFG